MIACSCLRVSFSPWPNICVHLRSFCGWSSHYQVIVSATGQAISKRAVPDLNSRFLASGTIAPLIHYKMQVVCCVTVLGYLTTGNCCGNYPLKSQWFIHGQSFHGWRHSSGEALDACICDDSKACFLDLLSGQKGRG